MGAGGAGLAGFSVEDATGRPEAPIYHVDLAADRVTAAAEAAHNGPGLVLTARAEGYLRGEPDLAATIARLQRYQEAGADVLFAPGMTDLEEIRTCVREVDRPVSVLLMPAGPSMKELRDAGVARVSVGGAFRNVALAAVARAAEQLMAGETADWVRQAAEGRALAVHAFEP